MSLNNRNKVYIGAKPPERSEDRADLYEYATIFAESIKNVPLPSSIKDKVARGAVDHVLLRYNPKAGTSFGGALKYQISADLEVEYLKLNIKTKNPPKWPHRGKTEGMLGEPKKKASAVDKMTAILNSASHAAHIRAKLKPRQQKILDFFLSNRGTTYQDLVDSLGITMGTAHRDVDAIFKIIGDSHE